VFDSLANHSSQQQTSAADAPPRTSMPDDTLSSRENAVVSCDDSAAVNSAVSLSALQSPSTSQKRSLSLNLFINKGLILDRSTY